MTKQSPTVKSAAPKTGSLEEIREQIAALQAEIREVQNAPLPTEMIADQLRREVQNAFIRPADETDARLDSIFANATGRVASLIPGSNSAESVARLALAFVMRREGEALIRDGVQRAEGDDISTGRLRLDPIQKAERLAALHGALYALEVAEEAVVTVTVGAERRPDANAAAVLGIPSEVAAQHGYFMVA